MAATIDHTARFWAYSNYLIALSRLIETEHPSQEALVGFIVGSGGFQKIYRGTSIPLNDIAQSLRLSWYTELLLRKMISCSEILPYATPWSMVQTYYAIYPAIRSYFMVLGREAGTSHETTLKTIGSDFLSCKGRFPHPWCCVYADNPAGFPFQLVNSPRPIPITLSNPLSSPAANDPWQHYGLFLRTTRQRMLERKVEAWKKQENRKHIPREQRAQLVAYVEAIGEAMTAHPPGATRATGPAVAPDPYLRCALPGAGAFQLPRYRFLCFYFHQEFRLRKFADLHVQDRGSHPDRVRDHDRQGAGEKQLWKDRKRVLANSSRRGSSRNLFETVADHRAVVISVSAPPARWVPLRSTPLGAPKSDTESLGYVFNY